MTSPLIKGLLGTAGLGALFFGGLVYQEGQAFDAALMKAKNTANALNAIAQNAGSPVRLTVNDANPTFFGRDISVELSEGDIVKARWEGAAKFGLGASLQLKSVSIPDTVPYETASFSSQSEGTLKMTFAPFSDRLSGTVNLKHFSGHIGPRALGADDVTFTFSMEEGTGNAQVNVAGKGLMVLKGEGDASHGMSFGTINADFGLDAVAKTLGIRLDATNADVTAATTLLMSDKLDTTGVVTFKALPSLTQLLASGELERLVVENAQSVDRIKLSGHYGEARFAVTGAITEPSFTMLGANFMVDVDPNILPKEPAADLLGQLEDRAQAGEGKLDGTLFSTKATFKDGTMTLSLP